MRRFSDSLRQPGLGESLWQEAFAAPIWPNPPAGLIDETRGQSLLREASSRVSSIAASDLPVVQDASDYRRLLARAERADSLEAAEAKRRERSRASGSLKGHKNKEAILAAAAAISAASKVPLRDTDIVRKVLKERPDLTATVKAETIRRWLREARK